MRKNIRKNPHSPRFLAVAATVDKDQVLEIQAALEVVKKTATAKFVESVDLAVKLGIDPKKGEQNVRGITNLPHGTGKVRKIAVLAKGDQAKEAEEAGADVVGAEELIARIVSKDTSLKFDVILATDEMAPQIGKIGRILGPKTPNKRNGTVTNNVGAAVRDIKAATRADYRADKAGVVHMSIGKVNYSDDQLLENFKAALGALIKAKPPTSKGKYLLSITVSASMGPGVPVEIATAAKLAG